MKITVGSAPDSWGVWFPEDAKQTPWQRFLDEASAAGYEWIELGPYGYLPTDPVRLQRELEERGLRVCATFVMFPFEAPDAWSRWGEEVDRTCALLSSLGAEYLILIDDFYTNIFTGAMIHSSELGEDEWVQLLQTTARAADVAERYGLRAVLHPHAESHIEYDHQIDRFLRDADPRIGLCLDVGHHAYRGGDPVDLVRRHGGRIWHVHLKNIDPAVRRRVAAERIPFAKAVALDMFVEPHLGAVNFTDLRDALNEVGYAGYGIVEQDMYPAPFDKPLPIAKRTRNYLRDLGIG